MNKVIKPFKENYLIRVFFISIFIAFCFFIPFIIYDKGYFLYYGDFNAQEIPFYKLAHSAIREGNIFWNIYTDLGANFIGSYSFYMLGSPFFWVTLLFPNDFVPYLMGPLLIFKFAFSALFASLYLKRYLKDENVIILGGLLYAFSGFSLYNIFFNHFHEAIVIFPLLLYSLDELMYKNKRGLFCFVTFLSCIMNYYFFVGQTVFITIYFLIKILRKDYELEKFKIFIAICEFFLGILLSSFLLIPSLLSAIQNPRTDNFPFGFDALLYSIPQRYLHIIESFFFPPDLPAMTNFTPGSSANWASVSAWLPLLGMAGVFAFFKLKGQKFIKTLIITLFVMVFIPILNSSFQAFNQIFYVRWFYMFILILALVTCIAIEKLDTYEWNKPLKISLLTTLAVALPIGLLPQKDNSTSIKFGLMKYSDRFWIYVAISLLCIFLLSFIFNFYKNKSDIINLLRDVMAVIIIVVSSFVIMLGKINSFNTKEFIIPYCLEGKKNINLENIKNCRSDVYDSMENVAMFWEVPNIQAFHTVVPGSIMRFYPSIGVERSARSKPDTLVYGVRALTSCRWLFDYVDKSTHFKNTQMPGWKYYDSQNNFDIWENEYYIPFGFTYDNYITKSQYESVSKNKRHLLLLKAMVLDEAQKDKYSDLMTNIDNLSDLNYTEDEYYEDCLSRKNLCCSAFNYDNKGFSAEIDLTNENDKLIFFSVPFEKGWSAKVNNLDTEIEEVNIGFMAVRVPGHKKSVIRFNYMTPGLIEGIIISASSLIVFLSYLIFVFKMRKRPHIN